VHHRHVVVVLGPVIANEDQNTTSLSPTRARREPEEGTACDLMDQCSMATSSHLRSVPPHHRRGHRPVSAPGGSGDSSAHPPAARNQPRLQTTGREEVWARSPASSTQIHSSAGLSTPPPAPPSQLLLLSALRAVPQPH